MPRDGVKLPPAWWRRSLFLTTTYYVLCYSLLSQRQLIYRPCTSHFDVDIQRRAKQIGLGIVQNGQNRELDMIYSTYFYIKSTGSLTSDSTSATDPLRTIVPFKNPQPTTALLNLSICDSMPSAAECLSHL